jgi:hypothetical protein
VLQRADRTALSAFVFSAQGARVYISARAASPRFLHLAHALAPAAVSKLSGPREGWPSLRAAAFRSRGDVLRPDTLTPEKPHPQELLFSRKMTVILFLMCRLI